MSTMTVPCPHCGKEYNLPTTLEGKKVRCLGCTDEFLVRFAATVDVLPADEPQPASDPPTDAIRAPGTAVPRSAPRRPAAAARKPAAAPPARGLGVGLVLLFILGPLAGLFLVLCVAVLGGLWYFSSRALTIPGPDDPPVAVAEPDRRVEAEQPRPRVDVPRKGRERPADAPRIDPPAPFEPPAPFQPPAPKKRHPWVRIDAPEFLPIKPPALEGDRVVRALPGSVADVAVGGGGRFLILHLPSQRQLAIFDVNEAKVVKYLPAAEDGVKFAAGMNTLVVALPTSRVLQRWSLKTFEREATQAQGFEGNIETLTMGSASTGPLLVAASGREHFRPGALFLDPATLKEIEPDWGPQGAMPGMYPPTARASADGTVFAFRDGGAGEPHTMTVLTLNGERAKVHSVWNLPGSVAIPGPDGRYLYMLGGVYNTKLDFLHPKPQNQTYWKNFIPAQRGGWYVQIEFTEQLGFEQLDTGDVHFYMPRQEKPFARLSKVSGLSSAQDRRIHFIPDAKLLALVPSKGEQVILHRFDPEEALEKSGVDYLLVTSEAPPRVKPGGDYVYPLAVKSKKGGVKYRLEAGPKGMSVNAEGKVTWKAPAEGTDEDVILSVSDSTGQEVFHTFKVVVTADAAAPAPERPAAPPDRPNAPPRPPVKAPVAAAVEPFEIKPCPINGEREEKALPSSVRELTLGGGGRFVILSLPREKKIAIFDVNEAKVVKYLPLAEDDAVIAAGMDKLFVCLPSARVVQRWSLRTFERELAVASPLDGPVTEACMGWASDGPLLLTASTGERFGGAQTAFVDAKTLKKLDLPVEGNPNAGHNLGSRLRASGDGTVFARPDTYSARTYVLRDGKLKTYNGETSTFLAAPGADGSFVCTMVGVYTAEMRPIFPAGKHSSIITSPFVASKQGRFFFRIGDGSHDAKKDFTFYLHGTDRPFATMSDFSSFDGQKNIYGDEALRLSADKRYLLLPDAGVLIALPLTNDRLILQRFDLDALLEKSGVDYLLVTSRPPSHVKKGQTLTYPLAVKSKKGGVKYRLEAGPKGMAVDAAGRLTWKVPGAGFDVENDVIVSVADAGGREVFHTFKLMVAE